MHRIKKKKIREVMNGRKLETRTDRKRQRGLTKKE